MLNKLREKPVLLAGLLFLGLAVIFFNRALFPPAGMILGGHDMRGYYLTWHETVRQAIHSGHLPLWTPYIFNGYPILAEPQQSTFYPIAWLMLVLPINVAVSWYMLIHVWLAGMGMFLFTRQMGAGRLPALLAGVAFAYSGLLVGRLWAGHSTVYAVDAWTPWLALGLVWSVRRGSGWAAVLAGLPFGLAILAGHLPSFLYVGLIWGLLALYLLWTNPGRRGLVVRQAAIMAVVGLGLAAVQLVPFVQFSLASERLATADYEFATDYSLPPAHLITLLLPEFFGEPTRVGYWSVPTFEELTYYAGLLAVLGLLLGLRKPSRLTWFYVVLLLLGLGLALGRYGVLYKLAYAFLPPFQLVRAPGRAAFLYLFAVTALLAHSLTAWQATPLAARAAALGPLLRWIGLVVGLAGFAALAATGAVFMAVHPTDTSGRLWHQVGGYAVALLLLLLGVGLLWGYLTTPAGDVRRRRAWGAALILLVTADMWFYAFKMVRLEPAGPDALFVDAKAVIGETYQRTVPWGASLFIQNGAMQVQLPSVFGYDSLEPAAHIALASSVPDPRSTAYDVLGASYVIAPNALEQFTEGEGGLVLLAQQGGTWVYQRPTGLPVARLVYQAEVIADGAAAVARIHAPDFDPAGTAILAEPAACALGPAPATPGTAVIEAAAAGEWRIATQSDAPGLLLLAETAYPGWQVTVDGERVEWQTAYTTLRAVCVPAGAHVVAWRFVPTVYLWGALLSLLAVGVLVPAGVWWAKT